MARWAPEKKDQLRSLADEILHNYGHGRAVVAIDGPTGAGTRAFADDLADEFRRRNISVFRASIEDFHRSRKERERAGWLSPRAHYEDAYDYSLLRRILLDPFHTAGSTGFVLAGFDEKRDQTDPSAQVDHRRRRMPSSSSTERSSTARSLPDGWNFSFWLTTEPEVGLARFAAAGGENSDPDVLARQRGADELYIADADPANRASAIIDNTDPDQPRRVFADSC